MESNVIQHQQDAGGERNANTLEHHNYKTLKDSVGKLLLSPQNVGKFKNFGKFRCESFSIKISRQTRLRHATNSEGLAKIMCNSDVKMRLEPSKDKETGVNFLYCGISLPKNEVEGKCNKFGKQQRYGSVVLEFDLGDAVSDSYRILTLGTQHREKVWHEISQKLLVINGLEEYKDLTEAYRDFLPKYDADTEEWELYYVHEREPKELNLRQGRKRPHPSSSQEKLFWIHPEIVFPHVIEISWDKVSITFVDHICMHKVCSDCIIYRADLKPKISHLKYDTPWTLVATRFAENVPKKVWGKHSTRLLEIIWRKLNTVLHKTCIAKSQGSGGHH